MSKAFDDWTSGPEGDCETPCLDDVLHEQMRRAFEAGRAHERSLRGDTRAEVLSRVAAKALPEVDEGADTYFAKLSAERTRNSKRFTQRLSLDEVYALRELLRKGRVPKLMVAERHGRGPIPTLLSAEGGPEEFEAVLDAGTFEQAELVAALVNNARELLGLKKGEALP